MNIEELEKLANEGNTDAMFELGNLYAIGKNVDYDRKKASDWYAKAAEKGHVEAQYELGNCYRFGSGVADSMPKAVKWFAKAAEQGHRESQYLLALSYDYGHGVGKNIPLAIKWYTKAAEQGHIDAQHNLAIIYKDGQGVGVDYDKAFLWSSKAAEQGKVSAQVNMGFFYYQGYGVETNYEKAVEWFTKAAENNDEVAQRNLGICYYIGKGVPQSYEKAIEWFEKAIHNGNYNARNTLGVCYEKIQNYEMAFKWYSDAAERNDENAMENLGNLYRDGKGVEQNYRKAVYWYNQAIKKGCESAKKLLKELEEKGLLETTIPTDDSVFDNLKFDEEDGCMIQSFSIPFNKKEDGEMMVQCGEDEELTDAQHEAYKRYATGLDNYKKNMPQALLAYYKDNYRYIYDALRIDYVTEESLCNYLNIKCLYIDREGNFGWLAEIVSKSHAVSIILSEDTIRVQKGWALNSVRHGHITDEVLGDLYSEDDYWIKNELLNIDGSELWYELKFEAGIDEEITPVQRKNYLDYKKNEAKYRDMIPDALLEDYKDKYDFIEECWTWEGDEVPTEYDLDHITKDRAMGLIDFEYMLFKSDEEDDLYGWVASTKWGSLCDMDISKGLSFTFSEEGVNVGSDEDLWF